MRRLSPWPTASAETTSKMTCTTVSKSSSQHRFAVGSMQGDRPQVFAVVCRQYGTSVQVLLQKVGRGPPTEKRWAFIGGPVHPGDDAGVRFTILGIYRGLLTVRCVSFSVIQLLPE